MQWLEQVLPQGLGIEQPSVPGAPVVGSYSVNGHSGDGLTYSYTGLFARNADLAIMAKVIGLEAGGLLHLGPNDLGHDETATSRMMVAGELAVRCFCETSNRIVK